MDRRRPMGRKSAPPPAHYARADIVLDLSGDRQVRVGASTFEAVTRLIAIAKMVVPAAEEIEDAIFNELAILELRLRRCVRVRYDEGGHTLTHRKPARDHSRDQAWIELVKA